MLLNQLNLILSQLPLNLKTVNNNRNAILIQTYLSLLRNPLLKVFIKTISLINSSSIALVFIDKDSLIKKHNIIIKRLLVLKPLRLTNGLPSSFITHYFTAKITIGHYTESILFYVTKLLPLTLVILRMPQLKKHNLRIDFPVLELKFNSNYYTYNCLLQYTPNCDRVALYRRIAQLTLRYYQPIVYRIILYAPNRALFPPF